MRSSHAGVRVVLFAVTAFIWALASASLASAKGGWILKEQWEENIVGKEDGYYHSFEISTGAGSGTQGASFGPGPTYKERGGSTCQGSWSVPPASLRPGDKIPFAFQSHIKGWDSRGSYYLYHRCSVGCRYLSMLDADGNVTKGSGCGINPAEAGIGGGEKVSDDSSIVSEWKVPEGSHGSGMILYLGTYGPAGTGQYAFKYVYDDNADPPPPRLEPLEPINPSIPPPEPYDSTSAPAGPDCPSKDSGARFTDYSGEVTVWPELDPDDTHPASPNFVLKVCDHVVTEDDSSAIISFADMTTFIMKPSTEIVLDNPPARRSKLSLIAGKIWVNFKKMLKDGSMDVTMKQAVAGCKGTTLVLHEKGTSSSVKVIEGVVGFRSLATGEEVDVTAGQTVTATAEGLSKVATFDLDAEIRDWRRFQETKVPVGEVRIASTHNKGAVTNGPSVPVVISTKVPVVVKTIRTYHWNGGRGSDPGSISIQGPDGRIYGPWQAKGLANLAGKPGPPNLYWLAEPDVVMEPGKYRILDSDPATWATNAEAGNRGFFRMEFQEVEKKAAPPEIELGTE